MLIFLVHFTKPHWKSAVNPNVSELRCDQIYYYSFRWIFHNFGVFKNRKCSDLEEPSLGQTNSRIRSQTNSMASEGYLPSTQNYLARPKPDEPCRKLAAVLHEEIVQEKLNTWKTFNSQDVSECIVSDHRRIQNHSTEEIQKKWYTLQKWMINVYQFQFCDIVWSDFFV